MTGGRPSTSSRPRAAGPTRGPTWPRLAPCCRTTSGPTRRRAARIENDARGLTPRQVPVPGLHAKWLNTRQHLVAELAGLPPCARALAPTADSLHLPRPEAPRRRRPLARQRDRRRSDVPAYTPWVAVILENEDTAIHFAAIPGAIAVEGGAAGGRTAAEFNWLVNAPALLFWVDLDAHGFEILDGYRRPGASNRSILMDAATYEAYACYGTDLGIEGKPLQAQVLRENPTLEPAERAMYERLVGEQPAGLDDSSRNGSRSRSPEPRPLGLGRRWLTRPCPKVPALRQRPR